MKSKTWMYGVAWWASLVVGCAGPSSGPQATSQSLYMSSHRGLSMGGEQAPAIALPEAWTLEACVDAALGAHPALRAQHARWQAQTARARAQAVQFEDPVLSYTFAPLPIQTRLGAQRHIIAIEQPLWWPGQLAARAQVASSMASAEAAGFDAEYLQIRRDVTMRYWAVWEVEQTLEVLGQKQIILEGIEQGLRGLVEVGRRPASSLARMGVARVALDERTEALLSELVVRRARLVSAMGSEEEDVSGEKLATVPEAPDELPSVQAITESGQLPPHIERIVRQTRGLRESLELERLDDRPDLRLGAQWSLISAGEQVSAQPDAGQDAVMVKVGVSLPVWRGARRAKLDAAEAAIVASQAEESVAMLAWTEQLRTTRARIEELDRQLEVLQTTWIPMTRAAFEMTRGDYEAERVDFVPLLQSVDALFDLELRARTLRAQRATELALWQWLVAEPVVNQQEPM